MAMNHVVVDGSNIATEGRSMPSLRQLDEAVTAFLEEHGDVELTVVVDATFGHRIGDAEKAEYEEAILNGELVTPPAGAIGRGDAFVLQIADKAKASVFSNDSFQEFHGTYDWLFEEGRLIGGKPVRNVGWVFVLRTPVRGPASRRSTRDARVTKKPASASAEKVASAAKSTAGRGQRKRAAPKTPAPVPDVAPAGLDGKADNSTTSRTRRRRTTSKALDPINEPIPFLEFVGAHPVGSVVDGLVDRFSSHGAYVVIDGALCYIPLKAMGDPPPNSAREVLETGEVRSFVVQSFDSPRRGIDLALPGFVEDEAEPALPEQVTPQEKPAQEAPSMAVKKKATARKAPARKAPARKTAARKAPAKKKATKKVSAATKKARSSTKKVAKKATRKASKATKTVAKRAKKAAKSTKKAPAKRSAAKKAPARKTAARKTARKTTARKTAARKAPAKRSAARKSTTRSAARRAPAKRAAAARS
jgi:hypothetical protein